MWLSIQGKEDGVSDNFIEWFRKKALIYRKMRFVRKMTAERKDNRYKLSQMYDMFIKKKSQYLLQRKLTFGHIQIIATLTTRISKI